MTKFRTIFAIPEIALLAYVHVDCHSHVVMFVLLFATRAILVLHAMRKSSNDAKEITKRKKCAVATRRILSFVIRNVANYWNVENMYVS